MVLAIWLPAINAVVPLSLFQDANSKSDVQTIPSFSKLYVSNASEKFILTNASAGAQEFSIAMSTRFSPQVIPLMPEMIIVEGQKDQKNPLYDDAILHAAIMTNDNMAVVGQAAPKQIAYVERLLYPAGRSIMMSESLLDAEGKTTSGIKALSAMTDKIVVAAVAPHDGLLFGMPGSGIALISADTIKIMVEQPVEEGQEKKEPKEQTKLVFRQLNTSAEQEEIKAIPFDKGIKALAYNHELASMDDKVVMHWDSWLRTMYFGISGQTGAKDDAGICSVVALNIVEKSIQVKPLIAPELFSNNKNEIIGAKGAHAQVTIHGLKTMHAEMPQPDRMGLSYLIVHGGNGDAQSTKRTIYALPLVNKIDSQEGIQADDQIVHATVAQRSDMPLLHLQIAPRKPFVLKVSYGVNAQHNAQLYTTEQAEKNAPAHVGAGPVPYGDVTNMFVVHDGVYAVIGKPDSGYLPQVCYSEPIYDALSRIVCWTQWKTIFTTNQEIIDAGLDAMAYQLYVITKDNNATVLNKSKWESSQDKTNQLTTAVNKEFPQGLQLLADYSDQGYMLAASSKKIAIIPQSLIDASIGLTDSSASLIVNSSGALTALEYPTTSAVVQIDSVQHLCAAGIGGIVIAPCTDPVVDQLQFASLGSYKYVRKLIAVDDCLYVLTDKTIDRINLRASDICANKLSVTCIVDLRMQLKNQYATISDMVVSGKLLLLATSLGLFRNVSGTDVTQCARSLPLQAVELPEESCAISHLYTVSTTGRTTDVSKSNGMVYVITGSRSKDRARLHRLAINDTHQHAVNDATVQLIQDCIINGTRCEFRNLGAYYDHIFTQGTLFLNARNKDATQPTVVNRGFRQGSHSLFTGIDEKASVHAITRNAARGNLLIAGDFGLQMQ